MSDVNRALARRDTWGNRIQIAFFAAGRRYLLKEWPHYCRSDEEVRFALAVQDCAREGGVPVPAVAATSDGDRVFDWRSRRFSLQHFVGEPYDPERPQQILNCAAVLGQYHAAVRDFRLRGNMKPGLAHWRGAAISRNHLRLMNAAVAETPLPPGGKRQVREVLSQLQETLQTAEEQMERLGWSNLGRVPVHGDFHQFNCRFEGDGVVGVVDFDNSRLEPRLYDVAYALDMMLGLDWRSEWEKRFLWRNCRLLEPAVVNPWLAAYCRQGAPFSELEKKLLPLLCVVVWPEVIHGFFPTSSVEVSGCGRVAEFVRYLVGNSA